MIPSPTDTLHMRAVATMLDSYASAFPERRTAHLVAWAKDLASRMEAECPPPKRAPKVQPEKEEAR